MKEEEEEDEANLIIIRLSRKFGLQVITFGLQLLQKYHLLFVHFYQVFVTHIFELQINKLKMFNEEIFMLHANHKQSQIGQYSRFTSY